MAPRCIVEIRGGKLTGTKAVLDPGRTLRVGRSDLADLVVPHDAQLSAPHFELTWDGARCTLRDLRSLTGTRLDGAAVAALHEAEVQHGAWIQAGHTDFMVYVEGHTPPPADAGDDDDDEELDEEERRARVARRAAAERALAALRDEAAVAPLYVVLDAARDDRILELLRESVERHQSLYEGQPAEPLDEVAPYLAGPMAPDSRLLERLVREGWGRRWGIFCTSEEKFAEVRRHFRRFLMAELEDELDRVYFRFYDPRVMSTFLPVCSVSQLDELTRQLTRILCEDRQGRLLSMGRNAGAGS
ncbi:hypothetical protein SOCE26_004420 [Sorangium cellulosum]|uniref:FHA domain-containing protein n=1 Tax=Sorangium cellulosum TaxID=56 RepID=A0A2L0EIE3_SORCE|nr:DUF4123 domain-containing protein [Sorangium cellulosum]AUX39060.1 hypothetical protein SOCE26_004420 [Sorangium cellulosum]